MLSDAEAAAYVAAFIDGEGHVCCRKTKLGFWTRHVSFCNTDKQLLDRVVELFSQLGFEPTVYASKPPKNPKWSKRWTVYVARDRPALERFSRLIPIQSERKKDALSQALANYADQSLAHAARRNGREIPCQQCGKPSYYSQAAIDRTGTYFCSVECRGKSQRNRRTVCCEVCGQSLDVAAVRSQKIRFCSRTCDAKWRQTDPAYLAVLRSRAKSAAMARWSKKAS